MSATVDLRGGEKSADDGKGRTSAAWGKAYTGIMAFASKNEGTFHGMSFRHLDCQLLVLFLKVLMVPK